jgi:hypothetical protein
LKFSGQQYSANVFAQYFQDANVNPFLDEKRYPAALLENSDFGDKSWEISPETRTFLLNAPKEITLRTHFRKMA